MNGAKKMINKAAEIDLLKDEILAVYDDLHSIPELGWEEFKTSAYIESFMTSRGFLDYERVCGTGLVFTVDSGISGPTVALRVDIDALNIEQDGEKVCMHLCGHDAHTTMGLFTAVMMKNLVTRGKLKVVFQPCEEYEIRSGALALINAGVYDDVDKAVGIHLRPIAEAASNQVIASMEHGAFYTIKFRLFGEGAHPGRPHLGKNTVDAAANIISSINGIKMDPAAHCSAKVLAIQGGAMDVYSVPAVCTVLMDLRASSNDAMDLLKSKVKRAIFSGADMNECTAEILEEGGYVAAEPDPRMVELAAESIVEVLGQESLIPKFSTVGADDFHFITRLKPIKGVFLGLGCNLTPGLHSPQMAFEKEQLLTGIKILTLLVQKALAED